MLLLAQGQWRTLGFHRTPPFIVLLALPSFVILCTHVVLVLSSSIITCVDNYCGTYLLLQCYRVLMDINSFVLLNLIADNHVVHDNCIV